MVADEHEAAAAEIAGLGVDDGEGEADGYGGVDGVAALLQDVDAGVGGVVLDGDDHGVGGGDGDLGLEGDGHEGEESDGGEGASGQVGAPGGVVGGYRRVGFASFRSVVKSQCGGSSLRSE